MIEVLAPLPVLLPLLGAAGALLVSGHPTFQRTLSVTVLAAVLTVSVVLLLSAGGPAGLAPILGYSDPEEFNDPLPQALVLTAIVITFGIAAFLLSIIHRSWRLARNEAVATDEEDRRVAARRATDADELDPDDLAPEDRAAMHADSLPADADDLSDDVDLPVGGGGR